jgi:hypothetical protein
MNRGRTENEQSPHDNSKLSTESRATLRGLLDLLPAIVFFLSNKEQTSPPMSLG